MGKKDELALRLSREICQKLVERRLLGASKAAESLAWLGRGVRGLAGDDSGTPVLAWAGELTLRLIERGRARTPQSALETLSDLCGFLAGLHARLPAPKAAAALRSGVDVTLKLLEVSFISQSQVPEMVESLSMAAASVLPD